MKNPLLDIQFLLELDKQKNKTTFARITALTPDERPVEQIEGRVTGGSINVDGASAVRRTSSVTLVGMDLVIHDVYWALEGKYQLEIGVLNEINPEYPDIIWFKQGIYLITQFSYSESTNNFSISISGKDKMAKLNGEMGGNVPAAHDFGQYEEVQKDGSIKLIKLPLYDIIRESVHQYGGEPFHNIIINDLDQFGYELWDYRGQTNDGKELPMYYFYSATDNYKIYNVTVDGDMKVYKEKDANPIALSQIPNSDLYVRSNIDEFNSTGASFRRQPSEDKKIPRYRIAKIEYGETAGYHPTALVYAGDLNIGAGEAITSLLDKIKNMLGEFEYFYDLDGKFVFQKKKTYVSGLFTPLNGETVDPLVTSLPYSYKFEDGELVTTYSNNPNIGNVKNDFIVWGNKKGVGGADIPIHARYAIDHKPEKYNSFPYYKRYYLTWAKFTKVTDEKAAGAKYCKDIFGNYSLQTTVDFNSGQVYYTCQESTGPLADGYLYHIVDNIYYQTKDNKPTLNDENIDLYVKDEQTLKFALASIEDDTYPDEYYYEAAAANTYVSESYSGDTTGCEIRDWRELIYLMARDFYQHNESIDYNLELARKNPQWYNGETKWTIPYGRTGYEQYYIDLQGFWRQIYDPEKPVEFKELYTSKDTKIRDNVFTNLKTISNTNFGAIDNKRSIYLLGSSLSFKKIENNKVNELELNTLVPLFEALSLSALFGGNDKIPPYLYTFNGTTPIAYTSDAVDKKIDRNKLYYLVKKDQYYPLINKVDELTALDSSMVRDGINVNNIFMFQSGVTSEKLDETLKNCLIDSTSWRVQHAYSQDTIGTIIDEAGQKIEQYGYKEYSIPATFYEEVSPWMPDEGNYWSKIAYYQPEDLIFWFDFLDTYGELNQFSVSKIGDRTKVVNENTITSIYLKKTPDVQFKVFPTDKSQDTPTDFAYATIQIPDLLTGMFNISSQGIAASDKIDSLVYQHACCANSVTINTIPIYYLQPNTRIYAHSDLSKIDGDYIVSKISIPLTYNGTMSITATKVIKQLK